MRECAVASAVRAPVVIGTRHATRSTVRAAAGVTVVALIVRLLFVSVVRPEPVSDFNWYYHHAAQLVQGLGFTTNGYPTAYWPLGWPYFLAGVFAVFGPHVYAGEIAQAVLNALTATVVFFIAEGIAGIGPAIGAALIYAFLPSAVEWSAVLASEPLYTLLWAAATLIWLRAAPQRLWWFAISGVIVGAAALVRPTAMLAWCVLPIYLWIAGRQKTFRCVVLPPLVVLSLMLATVAPDLVRNYRVFHTFVLVCNTGGLTLWTGNNPYYRPGDVLLYHERLQRMAADPRTEVDADRLGERMALSYIAKHPRRTFALMLPKLRGLYARDDGPIQYALNTDSSTRLGATVLVVNRTYYYAMLLLALWGIFLCARSFVRDRLSHPAWLLIFFNIVLGTVPFAILPTYDRYHFQLMPYFAVFAGIAVFRSFRRVAAPTDELAA